MVSKLCFLLLFLKNYPNGETSRNINVKYNRVLRTVQVVDPQVLADYWSLGKLVAAQPKWEFGFILSFSVLSWLLAKENVSIWTYIIYITNFKIWYLNSMVNQWEAVGWKSTLYICWYCLRENSTNKISNSYHCWLF